LLRSPLSTYTTLFRSYPTVKVASELVWVKDENIYTSAGISAGIDLALAWVEEDCGATIAQEVARELVLFLGKSQIDPCGNTRGRDRKSTRLNSSHVAI